MEKVKINASFFLLLLFKLPIDLNLVVCLVDWGPAQAVPMDILSGSRVILSLLLEFLNKKTGPLFTSTAEGNRLLNRPPSFAA